MFLLPTLMLEPRDTAQRALHRCRYLEQAALRSPQWQDMGNDGEHRHGLQILEVLQVCSVKDTIVRSDDCTVYIACRRISTMSSCNEETGERIKVPTAHACFRSPV